MMTVNGASQLIHFDTSGNLLGIAGNYQPAIATADGGLVATTSSGTGVTLDANLKVTGAMGNLPIQSWTGNQYQYGSIDQVFGNPIVTAATLWAQAGANSSGNATASRTWFFRIEFDNDFDFIPNYPEALDSLKTDITSDASVIKRAAITALKQAFAGWPVTVYEGIKGGDHNAFVQTTPTGTDFSETNCGGTDPNNSPPVSSLVFYECNMQEAQVALQVVINNSAQETVALHRSDLIQAIGRGIGKQCCSRNCSPIFRRMLPDGCKDIC